VKSLPTFLLTTTLAVASGLIAAEADRSPTPFLFSGNGFDFVLFLSNSRALPVSIDPSILRELSQTTVQIPRPLIAPARQLLESELKPRGFSIRSVSLASGFDVCWLTTPAAAGYFDAIAELNRGNHKQGFALLPAGAGDDSEFGRHCRQLRRALDAVAQRDAEIKQMDSELRANAEKFRLAKAAFSAAELAANAARTQAAYRQAIGPAQARYQAALDEANKTYAAAANYLQAIADGNDAIRERLIQAQRANLQTEALFLAGSIEQTYVRLRSLLDWMSREAPVSPTNAPGNVAEQLRAERSRLAGRVREAEQFAKAGAVFVASDPAEAHRLFLRAFGADSGALLARVGTGYCEIQRCITALKSTFEAGGLSQTEPRRHALEDEFRRSGKFGYLRALYEAQGRPLPPLDTTASAKAISVRDSTGVAAALTSDGVELAIVPKENEPDLLLVPADQLCRLIIVVADDFDAHLKIATKQEAERALQQLRVAQMQLLLGEREKPVALLQSVVATHPELYNARRLLELLRIRQQSEQGLDRSRLINDQSPVVR
jgi:hypothetical protein